MSHIYWLHNRHNYKKKYFKYSPKQTELTHSQAKVKPVLMSFLILQDLPEDGEKRQK